MTDEAPEIDAGEQPQNQSADKAAAVEQVLQQPEFNANLQEVEM